MPRHPPCALTILTVIKAGPLVRAPKRAPVDPAGDTRATPGSSDDAGWLWLLCSFQGPSEKALRAGRRARWLPRRARGLSKLNSMLEVELGGVPHPLKRVAIRQMRMTAASARSGRHARPHGRRPAAGSLMARGDERDGRRRAVRAPAFGGSLERR